MDENAFKDWSLAKVVSEICGTKQYEELIKDKVKRVEYGTVKLIKEWFKSSGTPLKGWRRYDDNEDEDDKPETTVNNDDY